MESVSDSIEADRGRGISRAQGTSSREMQFWSAEIPLGKTQGGVSGCGKSEYKI